MLHRCCGDSCGTGHQAGVQASQKCVRFESLVTEEDDISCWSPHRHKIKTSCQMIPMRQEFICKRVFIPSLSAHPAHHHRKQHQHHQQNDSNLEAWEHYADAMENHYRKQQGEIKAQKQKMKQLSEMHEELLGEVKELQEAADNVEEEFRAQMQIQKKKAFDALDTKQQLIWELQSDRQCLYSEIGRWQRKLEQSERLRHKMSQFVAVQTKRLDPFCY